MSIYNHNIFDDKGYIAIDLTEELNKFISEVKPIERNTYEVIDPATHFDKIFRQLQLI